MIQDKEKLEIPAKAPLHRDEFKNKIKNMSDLHTEIMLLSDEILSAQDEEVAENKEQLIAKMETLKNELRISERFKPAQAEVRLLENQLQEMEVRLGLRHAQDPVKETEKLFNRSSKDREIKRISKETDIKLEKVFEKPLTLEAITQQAIEILYMDDKEIFDKKEELFLKMEACEKHLEQEKSNPNRISSDIQATTMNLQNARERIDHAIKMYSSS
ncbi:MAG: hypothetical protein HWD61_05315 [Parachlamydiaceae bacterium]|nr:MAG: hypothetical protein HWD61_05315 [Parachlamydiaceae bacterium]